MISPNRENIDRWLFDYTEGNLSEDQVTILESYLLNNPDIEVDLDAWEDSKLVVENVSSNLTMHTKINNMEGEIDIHMEKYPLTLIRCRNRSGARWFNSTRGHETLTQ